MAEKVKILPGAVHVGWHLCPCEGEMHLPDCLCHGEAWKNPTRRGVTGATLCKKCGFELQPSQILPKERERNMGGEAVPQGRDWHGKRTD